MHTVTRLLSGVVLGAVLFLLIPRGAAATGLQATTMLIDPQWAQSAWTTQLGTSKAGTESVQKKPTPAPVLSPTSVPIATATQAPQPPPTSTPTVMASPTPDPTATQRPGHVYGLVGQGGLGDTIDTQLLGQQYQAGVRLRVVELGWDILQPNGPADWSTSGAQAFQQRIDAFLAEGPGVHLALDLGVQYTPGWVAAANPLVDQYGNTWSASPSTGGGPNVYWSPTVRSYVAGYIAKIFSGLDFHGSLWAVRVGPSHGELLYPQMKGPDGGQSFWAFDATAQAVSPVPGWKPGQPSPNGEAQRFYDWYVDNLTGTFNFFKGEIRRYYGGYIAPATPGWGVDDVAAQNLIANNLVNTSACCYGTGNYWPRINAALPPASEGVINWCSSVGDGSGSNDASSNYRDWSSAHWLAYLAHNAGRQIYGENPGHNAYDTSGGAQFNTTMQWDFQALQAYGYLGLMWVRQGDMTDPSYASLSQYASMIAANP